MTAPARRLHVAERDTEARSYFYVDEHGERHDAGEDIQKLQDRIKGLASDVAKWQHKYFELERDKEAEALAHHLWPKAMMVFQAWQQATGHTRSDWNASRFWTIEPYLRNKKYGPEICLRAVAGIAYDHWSAPRKNGSIKHFNEWERIFKTAGDLEERANAAPKGWREAEPFVSALERVGALNASAPHPKARR